MEAQLKRKVVDLYQWADEKDLERSHVTKEVINGEDKVHKKKEKGDKIGTNWKEDTVGVNDGEIRNANECIHGTVMAPRRKVIRMENLDSCNERIPGNREIDSGNEQTIQDRTTLSLTKFIHDDLVQARTPNRETQNKMKWCRYYLIWINHKKK